VGFLRVLLFSLPSIPPAAPHSSSGAGTVASSGPSYNGLGPTPQTALHSSSGAGTVASSGPSYGGLGPTPLHTQYHLGLVQ
jgi:hypothetical protein